MRQKLQNFSKKIHTGLKQEFHETKEIPTLLKNAEYKKAFSQLGDIVKMLFLTLLWLLPGGGVLSAFITKYIKKIRPSAFLESEMSQTKESKSGKT